MAVVSSNTIIPEPVLDVLRRHRNSGRILCRNPECRNDDPGQLDVVATDEYGYIDEVRCLPCGSQMSTKCRRNDWNQKLVRVRDVKELKSGDHLQWHRLLGHWHHAIFIGVAEPSNLPIGRDEESFTERSRMLPTPTLELYEFMWNRSTQETQVAVSREGFNRIDFFRVEYRDCYDDDYTIERANSRVGGRNYNVLTENCEHFAEWAKTGHSSSGQVNRCREFLGRNLLNVVIRLLGMASLAVIHAALDTADDDNSSPNSTTPASTQDNDENEERRLNYVYVCLFAFIFMVYRIKVECSAVKCSLIQNRYRRNNCCLKCTSYCSVGQRWGVKICSGCTLVCQPIKYCGKKLFDSRTKYCNSCCECCQLFNYALCCCCCIVPCSLVGAVSAETNERFGRTRRHSRMVDRCSNYAGIVARVVVQELLSLAGPFVVSIAFENKIWYHLDGFCSRLFVFGGIYLATSLACFVVFNTFCQPGRWLEWCIDRLVERCHDRERVLNGIEEGLDEAVHVYDYT